MAQKAFALVFGFLLITGLFVRSNALAAGQEQQGMQSGQTGQVTQEQQGMRLGQTAQVGEPKQNTSEYDPFFGMLHELNMTDAQKADVAQILKSHEPKAKTLAKDVAQAGVEIRKDFLDGKFNREHFDKWVKYEQEGAQLRATIMASILPKLNQQQQAALRDMQQKIASNLDSQIDARFARLNDWISQNSKGRG